MREQGSLYGKFNNKKTPREVDVHLEPQGNDDVFNVQHKFEIQSKVYLSIGKQHYITEWKKENINIISDHINLITFLINSLIIGWRKYNYSGFNFINPIWLYINHRALSWESEGVKVKTNTLQARSYINREIRVHKTSTVWEFQSAFEQWKYQAVRMRCKWSESLWKTSQKTLQPFIK